MRAREIAAETVRGNRFAVENGKVVGFLSVQTDGIFNGKTSWRPRVMPMGRTA